MKTLLKILIVLFSSLFLGCDGKEEKKKESFSYEKKEFIETKTTNKTTQVPASKKIALENKGIGPITSIQLSDEIDQVKAKHGETIFNRMCSTCHRLDKKFIGPASKGLLERRSPEWIMNIILNPEEMVQKDPIAKELFIEFNYVPMIKQDLTREDARAILEYYRTLK